MEYWSGYEISLIREPWLGTGVSIFFASPVATALRQYSVSHLIDQDTKTWNEHMVQYTFEERTAQQIIDTPLFEQVHMDRLVWKQEKNRHYSVPSAYRLCVKDIVNNTHLRRSGYWSGIWKLKVPPKVKNSVWQVCRECFPTRVRLPRRGVYCPSTCVMCNDPHEDSYHFFFQCCTAVSAWRAAGVWHLIEPLLKRFDDAPDIIFNLLENVVAVYAELIATVLWSIWKS